MNATTQPKTARQKVLFWLLTLIGPTAAVWVWASALSFVPVPWPDDSAFYFVAKDFFHWPPRWVMLPQAPFEPTYRIWNFNTMPLYPILLGLGRLIGIDGSHALKFWPLGFWALSGSFFAASLYRAKLPAAIAAIFALAIAMDPALRWGSVLVRPESLIGLCGIILVTGLSLGWFKKQNEVHASQHGTSLWDPIAALLAVAAYAHFNAVHILFAVLPVLIFRPRRLFDVGLKASLYLFPWLTTVALKPRLFVQQMTLQWSRLAVPNDWLKSVPSAIRSIFQNLGSPEDWPTILQSASVGIWLIIFAAIAVLVVPSWRYISKSWRLGKPAPVHAPDENPAGGVTIVPAAGWVIGAVWLWNNKPEVWFTYYLHLAVWTFAGLATLKLWLMYKDSVLRHTLVLPLSGLTALTAAAATVFMYVNVTQASRLSQTESWNWKAYNEFVSCVDRALEPLAAKKGPNQPLQVWAPTFPDITIELSRRHPDWDLSRTNDFWSRSNLAIMHGYSTDAVVVTETLNWPERDIDAPWNQHPEVRSVWMDWKDYYLNRFITTPGWKPNRHLCQKGRWQAFIFMN